MSYVGKGYTNDKLFVLDDVIGIKAEDDIGTVKVFKTLDDFLDFIEDINDSLKVEVITDNYIGE